MQPSSFYTIGFAAAVCGVCSIFVSGAAVGLKPLQEENKVLDRQKKVLVVAGLMEEGEAITPDEVRSRFDSNIRAQIVDLDSGKYDSSVDAASYDQRKAAKDPATSETAPPRRKHTPHRCFKKSVRWQSTVPDRADLRVLYTHCRPSRCPIHRRESLGRSKRSAMRSPRCVRSFRRPQREREESRVYCICTAVPVPVPFT